jgi:hypothetical protein
MGFTQKASCRPYKNCYKGGVRTTRKKQQRSSVRSDKKNHKEPKFYYHSEHFSMTSHPADGEPFGSKTVVTINKGKGTKTMANLNKAGNVTKQTKKTLKKTEVKEIVKGNYVPGLWTGF